MELYHAIISVLTQLYPY